jgi:hypothetical protein
MAASKHFQPRILHGKELAMGKLQDYIETDNRYSKRIEILARKLYLCAVNNDFDKSDYEIAMFQKIEKHIFENYYAMDVQEVGIFTPGFAAVLDSAEIFIINELFGDKATEKLRKSCGLSWGDRNKLRIFVNDKKRDFNHRHSKAEFEKMYNAFRQERYTTDQEEIDKIIDTVVRAFLTGAYRVDCESQPNRENRLVVA